MTTSMRSWPRFRETILRACLSRTSPVSRRIQGSFRSRSSTRASSLYLSQAYLARSECSFHLWVLAIQKITLQSGPPFALLTSAYPSLLSSCAVPGRNWTSFGSRIYAPTLAVLSRLRVLRYTQTVLSLSRRWQSSGFSRITWSRTGPARSRPVPEDEEGVMVRDKGTVRPRQDPFGEVSRRPRLTAIRGAIMC